MSPLFGKKQTVQALAEVLEDGRAIMAEELKKSKYTNYAGNEPMLQVGVRVQPASEPAFEAKMKVGLSHTHLLKPGVRVQVKYEPGKPQTVALDDDNQAILARNPDLVKKSL
jgi:hypothetical protein